jgi:NAD(P)-dependent dehydrogenase (short-subunit alcohol dehydrogenase family)
VTGVLDGKRVLVVGASAGIGRAVALRAVGAGASVVMVARRADRLAAAVEEAGGGSAVMGDVREPGGCARIVGQAAATLGGIDLLFFSAGTAPLRPFVETTHEQWQSVLETNLIGIHQIIRAAIPCLATGAIVAAVSSESVGQPRSSLGAYIASKAALEQSFVTWRTEHPRVRFSCITVGATQPTEFGHAFDVDYLTAALEDWATHGLAQEEFMVTDDLAAVLVDMFGTALRHPGVGLERITLRSPSAVVGSAQALIDHALGTRG